MRRIAIQSLLHDRARLLTSLSGVSFASLLTIVQLGLYAGFLDAASALIGHFGGDVWVMARGTEVFDNAEILSASARATATSHLCVRRARPLVFSWVAARKGRGTRDFVSVVGVDVRSPPYLPWNFERGLPSDLGEPMRIAIDGFDAEKLQLGPHPLGEHFEVGGHTVAVSAVSAGVKSFALVPFVFTDIGVARRLAGMTADQTNYWVLDATSPDCIPQLIASIDAVPELKALRSREFLQTTQDYWMESSGAGSVIAFSTILGLIVGIVIVGQTLYGVTNDHRRELSMLRAIGATRLELVGFVFWQVAVLVIIGIAVGFAGALVLRPLAQAAGIEVLLTPQVVVTGAGMVLAMCATAGLAGLRRVLTLEAAEVFNERLSFGAFGDQHLRQR